MPRIQRVLYALLFLSIFSVFSFAWGIGNASSLPDNNPPNAAKAKFFEDIEKSASLVDFVNEGKYLRLREQDEGIVAEPEATPTSSPLSPQAWQRTWSAEEIIKLGYVPGEVVIKFKKDAIDLQQISGKTAALQFAQTNSPIVAAFALQKLEGNGEINLQAIDQAEISLLQETFLQVHDNLVFANISVFKVGIDVSVPEVVEYFSQNPDIESITPNYVFEFATDENVSESLSLQLQPQASSTVLAEGQSALMPPDSMENNPQLLNSENDQEVVVAVLDTGVAYKHQYLVNNMWDGSNCKDAEGDPLGGCIHGYDFVNDDKDPVDDNGHGTSVAGVMRSIVLDNDSALWNNQKNVKVRIMAVKIAGSYAPFVDVLKGIQFAKENQADIINASFGARYVNDENNSDLLKQASLKQAIGDLDQNNILFVASAGNNKWNNDDPSGNNHIYPSDFDLENIISVAALSTSQTNLWDDDPSASSNFKVYGSNWGTDSVDIAAPGEEIETSTIEKLSGFGYTLVNGKEVPTVFFKNGIVPEFDNPPANARYYFEKTPATAINQWGIGEIEHKTSERKINGLVTYTPDGDYEEGVRTSVISPIMNLSGGDYDSASVGFFLWCDTEANDYLEITAYDEDDPNTNILCDYDEEDNDLLKCYNPIRVGENRNDSLFAGTWLHHVPFVSPKSVRPKKTGLFSTIILSSRCRSKGGVNSGKLEKQVTNLPRRDELRIEPS